MQVTPVKDGPLPKSRVASATLEMAPLQISQMESLKNTKKF